MAGQKIDVYQIVTDRMVAELEKGIIPWRKPWIAHGPATSRSTGKRYNFINQMLLPDGGEYITFMEALNLGGHVKKGEKGHCILSWARIKNKLIKEEEWENARDEDRFLLMPKLYTVFELSQCEGLERKYTEDLKTYGNTPVEAAETIIRGYLDREKELGFLTDGNSAFYSPDDDSVTVPDISRFENVAAYYSTAFHELTHSTLKASRCDREAENKSAPFGSEKYSKEELVAEIGAAGLCNVAGIEHPDTFKNSVAYLQGWLKALKNDKKFIVSASAKADKAVNYILGNREVTA